MPTFTIKLSELMNQDFDFGLTEYPIFDPNYRDHLNNKILNHYYNYEIGQETESMFRFALNRKMNEIMPLYNQVYLSEWSRLANQIDPLQTVNITDIISSTQSDNRSKNQSANATNTSGTKGRVVGSETPQVLLSPNEDYASSAQNTVSQVTATSEQSGTDTETVSGTADTTRTTKGSQGVAAEILLTYRATLLNVDMMVIGDLGSLFMQIWDNGDEFSKSAPGLGMSGIYGYPIF